MHPPPILYRLGWRVLLLWWRLRRPVTLGVRVIVARDDCVLLVRHSYVEGWYLPGGGVGRGETGAQAAVREVREETGLTVVVASQPFGLYGRCAHGTSDHVAVYVASDATGQPRPDGGEIVEAGFFPWDELPTGTTVATRRRLAEYRDGIPRAEHW